jgi:hypothetical protein
VLPEPVAGGGVVRGKSARGAMDWRAMLTFDRRLVQGPLMFTRTAVLCALVVALGSACSGGVSSPATLTKHRSSGPSSSDLEAATQANQAVDAEHDAQGTNSWFVRTWATPKELGGYVSPSSVEPGGVASLHVRSTHATVSAVAYRTGYYGGTGARQVWKQELTVQAPGPAQLLAPATRTWIAPWPESTRLDTKGWVPGHYLILLSAAGKQTWVPFTVKSPSVKGRVVIIAENATWQAYNAFGGASLYHGSDGRRKTRAYVVSFDRPLDYGFGSGDFFGNEMPMVRLAEQLRLPVAYLTDTDLEGAPGLLDGARAVLSLGHDEYWSNAMREQLRHARDRTGTNLAFFGANAIYRRIRLAPSAAGVPNRLETGYKSGDLDPVSSSRPSDTTADWPKPPEARDGKELTGAAYRCNPVHGDLVLTNVRTWITSNLKLSNGYRLPGILGSEYDEIVPGGLTPKSILSIAASPLTCSGKFEHADFAYYTVPSGAGGIDVGTSAWVCILQNVCGGVTLTQEERKVVTAMTVRILTEFAKGPAGSAHPIQ